MKYLIFGTFIGIIYYREKIQRYQMNKVLNSGGGLKEKALQSVLTNKISSLDKGVFFTGVMSSASMTDHSLTDDSLIHMQNEQLLDQQINGMMDPYKTPGVDMNIDESYHGIDHGMGIANPDHNHNF